MAGALTERDFVDKLEKAGFRDIEIHGRQPLGIDDLALYPLFTPDLLALMRRHIPPGAQAEVGVVVVLSARAGARTEIPVAARSRRGVRRAASGTGRFS